MTGEDLVDRLSDLEHDLGKYLLLPLGMLPTTASAEEVVAAVRRALEQTRSASGDVRSAAQLWKDFLDDVGGVLQGRAAFGRLQKAVEDALSWGPRVAAASKDPTAGSNEPQGSCNVDRAEVTAQFAAVREAIGELMREVRSR